ncbi:hypothetical protein RHSIM_Rhsim13G0062800 [Rhododendron simsii]|uniref:Uncharacterized protein n=1 Tax=Rhododendron simsii TaxID=118357 RepID=A0A834FY45_RHOSS|nr:hypothetical protein RHSIM_Rhsim13G0062800 [Rhododendron simsii]
MGRRDHHESVLGARLDGTVSEFREYFNTWITVILQVPAEDGKENVKVWQSEPQQRLNWSLPDLVLTLQTPALRSNVERFAAVLRHCRVSPSSSSDQISLFGASFNATSKIHRQPPQSTP